MCCIADFSCLQTSLFWRENDAAINDMLYKGYRNDGNPSKQIGAFPAGKSHVFFPTSLLTGILRWT